jgi:16S rRNA (cytosine1402-N4)-methyltransferase
MNHITHTPVMLHEAIDMLQVKPGKTYLDATIGMGGHAREMLKKGGRVIGLDQDQQALEILSQTLQPEFPNLLTLIHGNFSHLTDHLQNQGTGNLEGILFDVGTSALQLEDPQRGFSFTSDQALDMRMNQDLLVTAKDLVNGLSRKELYEILTRFSQEKRARTIADLIVRARQIKPIESAKELADMIETHLPRQGHLHPATKTFQALRMAVNDEPNSLTKALPKALALLKPKGRLIVISFHEGEDRIVKHFLTNQEKTHALNVLTPKPLTPSETEIKANPRSRSAKLRAAQKN